MPFENGGAVVEDDAAVVDHNNPLAQALDVPRIVAGQEDGRVVVLVQGADGLADLLFGNHIQPNRRLIQKDNARPMQERGGNFTLHPLPQTELAHGNVEQLPNLERLDQEVHLRLKRLIFQLVDMGEQAKGVFSREVVPQLRLLPKDRADVVGHLPPLLPRGVAQHLCLPAGGVEDARQHLDGGGFARAVGADEGQQFAGGHAEADFGHGRNLLRLRPPDGFQASHQPRCFVLHLKLLGQVVGFNRVHKGLLVIRYWLLVIGSS